jgi:hypothetical protein
MDIKYEQYENGFNQKYVLIIKIVSRRYDIRLLNENDLTIGIGPINSYQKYVITILQ